ncbi:GTP-binding protein [Corynebacterium zhongnanshanii]|uniref:sulfate adenylyltransferase n=1 Tax=Corynebacterium zhongnanshanii TaxID=2768834 RepID=A0ABQ6VI15_9CORY|nr:GTP-binding protein [Corynebacterium zhongnanshanii]KAB3519886.1 GTP-binding protein [Corynebacterium zhongnanshanii]
MTADVATASAVTEAEHSAQALPTLRLCTAGSVDDGKSTFVGRLLHDTKSILADQYESVVRVSTAKGLENPDLSLLVDGLRAEREQGITIDVAYRYFATDKRSFILADTPGHVQYTRNTVTGLSTSELAIILVDARNGVLEQTRRHLTVAAMMKISHVIVAVNKIDAVDFSEKVFNDVKADIDALVSELALNKVDIIPTSALLGDNVVERSQNTPWYSGPSVLEILETATPGVENKDTVRGLRFPIQIVIRDHATDYRGYAGRVAAGAVSVGDTVLAAGHKAVIEGIDGPEGEQSTATRGESVTLRLDREIDLSRGDLIAAEDVPEPVNNFSATVFHLAETPLKVRGNVFVRYGSALVRGRVDEIVSRLDISGKNRPQDEIAHGDADSLALNDIATVKITTAEPLSIEPYRRGGHVGSLLLIHPSTGDTLTAGLIDEQATAEAEDDGWDF